MKKTVSFTIGLPFLALFLTGALSFAENASVESKDEPVIRSLVINRSLLARYKIEYIRLKKEGGLPVKKREEKLESLKYKIQALNEHRSQLLSSLPDEKQAHEFMKDMLVKETNIRSFITEELAHEKKRSLPPSSGKDKTGEPEKNKMSESPGKTSDIDKMHEKALELATQHQYAEAIKLYEAIILKNPDDDEAYLIMGHLYLLSGAYAKAEEAFHNAVDIDPYNIHEIAPFYENIALQNPEDDSAYANLGYAYLILGDFLKAKDAFKNALSINPDNPRALQGLGFIDNQ